MAKARELGITSGRGADAEMVRRIARYKTGRGLSDLQRRDMDPLLEALEVFAQHREKAEAKLVAWETEQAEAETKEAFEEVLGEEGTGVTAETLEREDPAPAEDDEARWRNLAGEAQQTLGGGG